MSHTRALIVGISAYRYPGWDVPGPAAAAVAATRWLLSLKDKTSLRVDVFVSPGTLSPADAELMQDPCITLHEKAHWSSLDDHVRLELTQGCVAGTQLFVFWSGHGFTSSASNDRYFFCGDYAMGLPTRIFNGSNLLRLLRTHNYRCFNNQIFLADVCGVYEKPTADGREDHAQVGSHQLAYFATPEGKYADSYSAGGVFTETALRVLADLGDNWFDHNALTQQLTTAFAQVGATPFRIAGLRDEQELLESSVGQIAPSAGNRLFQSAHRMLSPLDVVERIFRPHFLRTVADLGAPELAKAQGLVGALQELSSMRDASPQQPVPHGLMQFLMRLAREPRLLQPIYNWLDVEAALQARSRGEIALKLAEEDLQKILMIEVQVNAAGRELVSFTPYLCHANGSFVQGHRYPRQAVNGWDDFCAGLQTLFSEFTEEGSFSNLQIHFLVDPPLFDRPFLDIPVAPGGAAISTEAVVVLRHRQRMLSSDVALRRKWSAYAEALRTVTPAKLKWLPIATGNAALPDKEGLCYATFSLPHPAHGAVTCDSEKQVLYKLLKLGTPFIYLPHADPGDADWKTVHTGLAGLMKKLPQLDALVERFRDARTRGRPPAAQATLLWDDPLCNPFISTRGVNDE